jgi:NTP pyrophosphatase (non-canonical NTP hydrolase)
VYPNKSKNLIYPILGLNEEAGEMADKLCSYMGSGVMSSIAEDAMYECGDVMWYLAALATELTVELSDIEKIEHNFIPHKKNMMANACAVNNAAGIIAGKLKKPIRKGEFDYLDVNSKLHFKWGFEMMKQMKVILDNLDYIGNYCLGYTLEEICEKNITKLTGRAKRGTLIGEGDKR